MAMLRVCVRLRRPAGRRRRRVCISPQRCGLAAKQAVDGGTPFNDQYWAQLQHTRRRGLACPLCRVATVFYFLPWAFDHVRGRRSARQHHDRSGISTRELPPGESPVACASRAARHRASPASLSAGKAVINTLFVASQSTTSSTSMVRVNVNDSTSARPKGASGGRVTK
jgi:hypothetical protein